MFVFLSLPYVGGAVAIYDPALYLYMLQYFLMAAKRNPSAFAEDTLVHRASKLRFYHR